MRHVLITGASGFIGSRTCAHLFAAGNAEYHLVGMDHWSRKTTEWKNVAKIPLEWTDWVGWDNRHLDAVIHTAWLADTTAPMSEFELCLTELAEIVRVCLDRHIHLVFLSSAAIYGREQPEDPARWLTQHCDPVSAYAWSKWQAETLIEYARTRGLSATVIRPFNVYGPNEYHKGRMASLALQLHAKMLTGAKIELFKSGKLGIPDGCQRRDWIYVDDVASIVHWSLLSQINDTFDAGTGEARTFLDFARICARLGDYQGKIHFIPMPAELAGQYQDFTQASMAKVKKLGYPFELRGIEEGLKKYYETYLLPGRVHA